MRLQEPFFLFSPNLMNKQHHRVFLYSESFGNSSPTSCASMLTIYHASNIGLVQICLLQFSTFGACLKSKYFLSRTQIPLNNVNIHTYIDLSKSSRIQRNHEEKICLRVFYDYYTF